MDYGTDGIPRERSLTDATLIKKHLLGVFLNDGTKNAPVWVRICNATEFTRSMNPQTEDRDYIADSQPTTELTGYKPSESFTVTAYKGEKDYDFFYRLYKKREIGGKAHRQLLLVSLFDGNKIEGARKFFAEVSDCTVSVTEYNYSDGTITVDLNENGSPLQGWVYIESKKPVFIEGTLPSAAAAPVFKGTLTDITYTTSSTARLLNGAARSDDGGTITYSWTKEDKTEVATTPTFTRPVDVIGQETYTVTATNTTGSGVAAESETASMSVTITVTATPAVVPVITAPPVDAAYTTSDTAAPLDATATVTDGGQLTYSWTKGDGTEVAATAAFTPPIDVIGAETYTATVTNTTAEGEVATAAVSVTITVTA